MNKPSVTWISSTLARAFLVGLLSAAGFGCMALLVEDQRIAGFDRFFIRHIQGYESDLWTSVMSFFTMIGTGLPVVLITIGVMAFLYLVLGHRRELVLLAAVVAGSYLLNELLKAIFHRSRPIIHRIAEANGYSFPSGHSMTAFSLYTILAFLIWKHVRSPFGRFLVILVSALFILMIGISRIYLGVHYPSDVVGGYLASACWLSSSIWFYQRDLERRRKLDARSRP